MIPPEFYQDMAHNQKKHELAKQFHFIKFIAWYEQDKQAILKAWKISQKELTIIYIT